jgi:hypothetical protein
LNARDYFDWVRDASRDAESIRRQLETLESRAKTLGGGGFEPRTRSTPDPKRMEGRIVAYMQREGELKARQEADYAIIGRACRLLYGEDEDGRGGVSAGCGTLHADVLWWRYLDDSPWKQVASVLGSSVTTCRAAHDAALRWIDESGTLFDAAEMYASYIKSR